jgi:hypothetical protein
MWDEKTPDQILADINAMFAAADDTQADLLVVPYTFVCYQRALGTFGQRVNRANRHKFRRHYLRVLQGAD